MTPRTRHVLRGIGKGLAFALFVVTTVALGVELLFRLTLPQVLPVDAPEIYHPDDAIGWRRSANVRAMANTGERDVEVCTDSRGDRVSCAAPRPASCPRRILVVGDSMVEALAIPFEQTAWARLERDVGACVDVAGVGAYGPSQYLKVVRERLRDRHDVYDVVVASMYASNDFVSDAERIPSARAIRRRPLRLLPAGLSQQALEDWFYPVNQWLESRSHAYVALRFAIRNMSDPGDVGVYGLPVALVRSRLTPRLLQETARSFALMADEVRHARSTLVITIVPIRNQVTDPTGARVRAAFPKLADEIDMDLVQKEFVPRLAELPGVSTVDLLPVLRETATPVYWGEKDGHLSPKGHAAWFDALRGPVRRALGLP